MLKGGVEGGCYEIECFLSKNPSASIEIKRG